MKLHHELKNKGVQVSPNNLFAQDSELYCAPCTQMQLIFNRKTNEPNKEPHLHIDSEVQIILNKKYEVRPKLLLHLLLLYPC